MEFTIVEHPAWWRIAVAIPLVYGVGGLFLARRSRYPVLFCIWPVLAAQVAVAFGLIWISDALKLPGTGREIAAAGSADAQMPLLVALVICALLAARLAVGPAAAPRWDVFERTAVAFFAIAIGAMLIANVIACEALLRGSIGLGGWLAKATFWAAIILAVPSLPAVLQRRSNADAGPVPRKLLLVIAATALVLFLAVWLYVSRLRAIAIGIAG
jgi:hypothetical protein